MSLLALENISKDYGNKNILNNVSLRVERGDRVALVGPNGVGKSTLIKIALGLEKPDGGNVIIAKNTKVAYLSQDMMELDDLMDETPLCVQEIMDLENKIKKLEEEMVQLANSEQCKRAMEKYDKILNKYESLDGYNIERKIMKILLGLGLKKEALKTSIGKLSGGERMRVLLAKILINEPDLIILDEPTNHLDIKTIEWLEKFFEKFNGGILMVSHDRYFLDEASTRIAELSNGTICERNCTYSNFVKEKENMRNYYKWEQKGLELKIEREKKVIQELKSHRKITAFKSREKRLNSLIEERKKTQETFKRDNHLKKDSKPNIILNNVKHVSKDIAWAKGLNKCFGQSVIIRNGIFNIYGGEKVAIVGDNGCGKTTLLNILLGKDKDFQGTAELGSWVKYAYLGQEVNFYDEDVSILEEFMRAKEMTEKEARLYLSRFQFYGDEVNKNLRVLSGGERVRVYLAEMLLYNPHCLIMDEPTNHLDLAAREAIEQTLKEYRGTIIAVSHDRYFLKNSVNKIIEIHQGTMTTFQGNYDFYREQKEKSCDNKINYENRKEVKFNDKKSFPKKDTNRNMKEIENQIIILEEQLLNMEKNFNEATEYEDYKKYDKLSKDIEALYEILE